MAYTEVFQQAEGVATLLEALGIENVRRSLYGDNKSALALCQGVMWVRGGPVIFDYVQLV